MKNEIGTLILAMLQCYNQAKSSVLQLNVSVTIELFKVPYNVFIVLDNNHLTKFKDCMCSKFSESCVIVLASPWKEQPTGQRVINIKTTAGFHAAYQSDYLCEYDMFRTFNILCRRQKKVWNALDPLFYIYESHCDLNCVKISWNDSQSAMISNNNVLVVNNIDLPPKCRTPTTHNIETTKATKTFQSTPPQTASKLSTSPVEKNSLKVIATFPELTESVTNTLEREADGPDKKIPIIIGVVIAVIVIFFVVTGIVLYRRRQHTKLRHTQSKNDANANSKPGAESISIALKSFRNNIQSRLKFSKRDTENINVKGQEVESSHQKRDYSTIDYASTENLTGDINGLIDTSNLSETNMVCNLNDLSINSNGIYNNSITDPKVVGSKLMYSTVASTSQIKGEINEVNKNNLSQILLENTYANFHKPPKRVIDQDRIHIIQDASSPNYELATNINLPVSDSTLEIPEAFALKPPAGEYSRLGDKNRHFKNPYNTHPDTDETSTLTIAHNIGSTEIEEPIPKMFSDDPPANIFSCQKDDTVIELSEYELATE
ncbi:unnamed protein product [Lymnaea stagnalis]|uniref:Uncharacterized protein n=1 Tax=Lymnaea stagnalis TaxID=6523 RepID=A0AAV2H735_LYMST